MTTPQTSRSDVVSSFTIIKGSLIEETYTAFSAWDLEASQKENIDRVRDTNLIGASSENWLRDVAWVLSRRFDTEGRDRPLVRLAQRGCPLRHWKPLLLWHMTRDEFLVRDFLVNWLYEQYEEGAFRVRSDDVIPYLETLPERDVEVDSSWSESTLNRVASGLLRIAADFGLLEGKQVREFTSYHLSDEALLYLLHAMNDEMSNARQIINAPDWKMYMMGTEEVERELFRLHQYRELHYEVAGSLAQLSLPHDTLMDYAESVVL
jgi:hypothetical protein